MPIISLLCPTKKRIYELARMWMSALKTAKNSKELELVLYIDYDDNDTIKNINNLPQNKSIKTIISNKDNKEIYSNLHNICCETSNSDIVFSCADDLIFRSNHWDEIITDKFNNLNDDKIGFFYPDDGHWGDKFGTHGFFHKNWFNTLGYLSPPLFTADYSDNYINDIAKNINRCFYVDSIFIEHMHWTFGKMSFDQTARESHINRLNINNREIYDSSLTKQKQIEDINKLLTFIEKKYV